MFWRKIWEIFSLSSTFFRLMFFPFQNPNKQKSPKSYHGIPYSPQDAPARLNNFNVSDESWPRLQSYTPNQTWQWKTNELKMYFLLKMGIFQPAMLVYQQRGSRSCCWRCTSLKLTACPWKLMHFLLGNPIFRCKISFREDSSYSKSWFSMGPPC